MNIVLYRPEIPQNTGNIARTCASTGARLHIIKPMGFEIDDKKLKRAGLDYWHSLDLTYYDGFEDFYSRCRPEMLYLISTKGRRFYSEVVYGPEDYLLFGQETAGLPQDIHVRFAGSLLRIPMVPDNRSLNLSNTVALVVYEALRQQGFVGLV